jgi:hypothetical protein
MTNTNNPSLMETTKPRHEEEDRGVNQKPIFLEGICVAISHRYVKDTPRSKKRYPKAILTVEVDCVDSDDAMKFYMKKVGLTSSPPTS